MTLFESRRGWWGTDLRGYLGERESWRVLGRWKVVEVRTLRALCAWNCSVYHFGSVDSFGESCETYACALQNCLGGSASAVAGLSLAYI